MRQIRVERQKGCYGMVRALKIMIDGVSIGKIDPGEISLFDAPDTCRKIWGKMDWGETVRLDIADYNLNQTVVFKGYFTFNIYRGLGTAKIPFKVFLREASENETGAQQIGRGNE